MATNPYQSPRAESELPDHDLLIEAAMSQTLDSNERVTFDFQLTSDDISRALRRTKIRPDLRTMRNAAIAFLLFSALIAGLAFVERSRGEDGMTSLSMTGLIMIVSAYLFLTFVWLVRQLKNANADRIGHVEGWIDRDHLWIKTELQTMCHPLKQLVAATIDGDRMAFCFDATHNFFFVFPINVFDNTAKLVEIGQALAKIRPPKKPLPGDASRLKAPDIEPSFRPADDAVFYSGRLTMDDTEGSQFSMKFRERKQTELIKAMALFGFFLIAIHLLLEIWTMTIFAGAIFLVSLVRLVIRMRSIGGADASTLWVSKGWYDAEGVVSIHARGQSFTKWSMFDEFEFTPRVLAIQAARSKNWHMTGRDQFASEADWQKVQAMVRERMSSGHAVL